MLNSTIRRKDGDLNVTRLKDEIVRLKQRAAVS